MNKVFALISVVFLFAGCGQKNETSNSGKTSGDSKTIKSDLTQGNTPGKIELPKFKMTFEREAGVYLVNSDLSGEKLLYSGHDNSISPDGNKVAYTISNNDGSRNIAIFDINNKTSRTLKSPAGKQSFDAGFSPDSKSIVFCNFSGKKWNIALVNFDDTGFKILTEDYKIDLFSPTFSPEGNSILCQDMQNFVEIDLNGKIVKSIPFKEVVGENKIYFSSASRPYYINNKEAILFDADIDINFETSREPVSNIFVYDLKAKRLTNLTDKTISGYDPFPLGDGKHILFSAYTREDLTKSPDPRDLEPVITSWIYVMNMDGSNKERIIKNAFEPSASKPE